MKHVATGTKVVCYIYVRRIQRRKSFNSISIHEHLASLHNQNNKRRGRLERILPSLYKYTTHAVFGLDVFFFLPLSGF